MINRNNKKLVDKYLLDREEDVLADNLSPLSTKVERVHLLLLLEFVGSLDFKEFINKFSGKSFSAYLNSPEARRDTKLTLLSPNYKHKALASAKHFFTYLQGEPGYRRLISEKWLKTFNRTRNHFATAQESIDTSRTAYFTLEEILTIARTPVSTLNEERLRAAMIFMFLSAMRISAFLTLPIHAVNMKLRTVCQYPEYGVHTKLRKKRKTKLFDIPELLPIVASWDAKVRSFNSPNSPWFTPISPLTGMLDPTYPSGKNRDAGFRKDLAAFMEKAGIQYRNPHQLRHGHIRFARDRSPNSLKALETIAFNTIQTIETMLKYAELDSNDANEEFDKLFTAHSATQPEINASTPELQNLMLTLVNQNNELMSQLQEIISAKR
jgi:integrase